MRKCLIVSVIMLLVGCSNTYVGGEATGIVKGFKEDKKTYTTMMMVGKVMVPQVRTSRYCYYDVEVEGNAVTIKTSGRCSLNEGDSMELKKIYNKETNEFMGFSVK